MVLFSGVVVCSGVSGVVFPGVVAFSGVVVFSGVIKFSGTAAKNKQSKITFGESIVFLILNSNLRAIRCVLFV